MMRDTATLITRDQRIFEMRAAGHTYQQIADTFGVSPYTVGVVVRTASPNYVAHPRTVTICSDCQNAVPSYRTRTGCKWSVLLQPVDGWDATEVVRFTDSRHKNKTKGYIVHKCPQFKKD